MCGRYSFDDDKDIEEIHKILAEIQATHEGTSIAAKTGEIFPTNNVPVLSLQGGKPALGLMSWGLPKWDGKGVIINARAESASQKPTFAKSLAERRCVIPSTGFYEWRTNPDKSKDKFLFNMHNEPMLYMAAIYSVVKDEKPIPERFAILTRAANDTIRDIHDRMPVILHKNELVRWLTDADFVPLILNRDDVNLVKTAV